MKGCELCDGIARMFCQSDQASLCWECDAKVHGANFLVARHPRVLLCRSCQAPTAWRAAGAKLIPTVTVCESCAPVRNAATAGGGDERLGEVEGADGMGDRMLEDEDDDEDDDDDESEDSDADEEEEGENQVVPWTLTPPPASSSSGEESSSTRSGSGFLKRMRVNADLASQIDLPFFSSDRSHLATTSAFPARSSVSESTASATLSFRPSEDRWRSKLVHGSPPALASSVGTGPHFHARGNPSSVDLVSSGYSSPPI